MGPYDTGTTDALQKLGMDKEAFWGLLARGAAASWRPMVNAFKSPWGQKAVQALKDNKWMVGMNMFSGWGQGGDSLAGKATSSLAHGALGTLGMKGMVGSMGLGMAQDRFRSSGQSAAGSLTPSTQSGGYGGTAATQY